MSSASSISDDFEILSHNSSETELDMEWRNGILSDEDNEIDPADDENTHTLYGNGIILQLADISEGIDLESDDDANTKNSSHSTNSVPAPGAVGNGGNGPDNGSMGDSQENLASNTTSSILFPRSATKATDSRVPQAPSHQFKGVLLIGPIKGTSQLGLHIADHCKGVEAFFVSEDHDFVPRPCTGNPIEKIMESLINFRKLSGGEILRVELEDEKPPVNGDFKKATDMLGTQLLGSPSIKVRPNNFHWIKGLADNNLEAYVDVVPADTSPIPNRSKLVLTTGFAIAAFVLAVLTSWAVLAQYTGSQQPMIATPYTLTPSIVESEKVSRELSTFAISTKDAIEELIFTWYMSIYNTVTHASNLVEEFSVNAFTSIKKYAEKGSETFMSLRKYAEQRAGTR